MPTTVERARAGEDVGRRGKGVGGRALVRGGGKGDYQRRGPGIVWEQLAEVRHHYDGDHADGHHQYGEFAAVVDGVVTPHEPAGEATAANRPKLERP